MLTSILVVHFVSSSDRPQVKIIGISEPLKALVYEYLMH